jgi:DHA1 family multidrug resistance protein-like MFS transporter
MSSNQSTIAGLCMVGFLARVSYSLARTPVLPLFAASFGVGPEAIGFAVAISTVTGIFFKMPAGVLSDVIGRPRTLLLGLTVFAVVPIAYLWVSSFESLVLVRFFHGFATAIYGPVVMAVVVSVAGGRRAELLSWFSSVTILGNLVGAPLGGLLLTLLGGDSALRLADFHTVYGIVAASGMASLLLALMILPRTDEANISGGRTVAAVLKQFRTAIHEILLDRRVLLTSNMEGVQNLTVGALEAFLPVYAVTVCGLSAFQAGTLWGVQILAVIGAKPLMGKISDRRGRTPLLFWGMFVCAVPFGLIPWTQNYWILLVLAACFGLGEAMVTSSAAALVADFCKEAQLGSAMGAFGTLFDVGHAAGPLLAGFFIGLSGDHDFRMAFAAIALLVVLAAFAFRTGVKEGRNMPQIHLKGGPS